MATKTKKAAQKVVKRGLKPRTAETYDKEEFMHGDSAVPPNDHTLNTSLCRIRLELPRAKEGPLMYRPWPAPLPENPEEKFQRGRVGAQPREMGNWLFPVRAASFLGLNGGTSEKHTFLLYPPGADKETKENNPHKVLFRACKKAFDSGSFASGGAWDARWNRIMKGSEKSGSAELTGPTTLWYTCGEVYLNGEKDYLEDRSKPLGADPDDELVIVRYSSGGGKNLMDLFAKQKKEWEGDEEKIPSLPYVYGDPVGTLKDGVLKGGWFIYVWNPKRYKFKPDGRTSWAGKIKDQQGYEVHLARDYEHDGDKYSSSLDEERVKTILAKYQFWMPSGEGETDGLLYFPPVEQQCLWIAKGFRSVPKLLQFGWADHPEFFTEDVRAILKARVQAVVPGGADEEEEEDTPKNKKNKKKSKARKDPTQEVEDEEVEDEEVEDEESEDEELDEEPLGEDDESDEESEDEESEDEESEDDEESDDEESDDEESDDEDDVPEEFRLDEEEGESEEFDPDEEVDDKKKSVKDKMKKSLKDAKGKSAKRQSEAKETPKPPQKKAAKKAPAKKAPAKKGKK